MLLHRLLILAAIVLFTGCVISPSNNYDAVVDKNAVVTNNSFTSLQSALDAAPENSTKPYKIFITSGDYYEKITITKPHIQLIGADEKNTRLFYDAYSGQVTAAATATEPQKTWGTSGSATLTIRSSDVQLHRLTIENSFDFLTNDALANDAPTRVAGTQAVALLIDTGSDRTLVRNVRLLGYQDTLYVNAGRSWFDKTFVAGNVDFIFGRGNALFTDSEIHTLGRGKAENPHGYVVAPSTQISDEFGLTFINCKLTRDQSVADNTVPLGRPWHPTTQFSDGRYADPNAIGKAVFINTWMDAHITHNGWYAMGGTAKDGSRIQFLPEDSRFFEYNSTGPGAGINSKRRQLSDAEAKRYTREQIHGNWK